MINEVLDQLTYLKELHIINEISNIELKGIYKVLNKECEAKEENNRLYNVKLAGFPFLRTVDNYDFSFQPSIKEEKIRSIIESNFYNEAMNVVLMSNPGTGKAHLAISIAYSVAIRRNSVYFIKFNKLTLILKNVYNEGTFNLDYSFNLLI